MISKQKRRLFILVALFLFMNSTLWAQQIGIGGALIYNPQTQGLGLGARVELPFNRIYLVPQFSYYPSFNKVTEYYAGISGHLDFLEANSYRIYLIAHAAYNRWINYDESPIKKAKKNNWDAELGLGWTTRRCLRPFIEYRYNFKWKETNLNIGLIYTLNCRNPRKRTSILCPTTH